jgi:hypothetical protein
MMRSIGFAAVALCLALSSCANIKTAYDAVTTSTVPAQTINVAINGFNIVKTAATGYIAYCTPNPTPAGCDDDAIQNKIMPAIDSGTTARNTLKSFLREHPGSLGDKGTYDALVTASSTLQTLLATYDKR